MKKPPCYQCEKRQPGCHGKCAEYQEWDKQNAEKRERILEQKIEKMRQYPAAAGNRGRRKSHSEV